MIVKILSGAEQGTKTIYTKNLDKAADRDLAVYISTQSEIEEFRKSTILFSKEEIMEKALFDQLFAYEDFARNWYNSKKIRASEYAPTFHIKHFLSEPLDNYGTSFQNNYKKILETFQNLKPASNFVQDSLANLNSAIEDIYKTSIQETSKHMKASKYCWSSLCCGNIQIEDYKKLLQELYLSHHDIMHVSEFKKAVAYLGYRLYEVK